MFEERNGAGMSFVVAFRARFHIGDILISVIPLRNRTRDACTLADLSNGGFLSGAISRRTKLLYMQLVARTL